MKTVFTGVYEGRSNVLKSSARVRGVGTKFALGEPLPWTGIWDTGAVKSLISWNIVDRLNLRPVKRGVMMTSLGKSETDMYLVDIGLPNGLVVGKLLVFVGQVPGADLLIGMDIINQGDFAVTNFGGKTVFTYRAPSVARIDFRNEK